MTDNPSPRLADEPWLLTPGPLTTPAAVKMAMLRDWGSWDADFRELTARVRHELLAMAGVSTATHQCVPMQGSGSFGVEAMLGSLLPRDSETLVLSNGAYGLRIAAALKTMGRRYVLLDKGDYLPPTPQEVGDLLDANPQISDVVLVHCETSSGILNPIEAIANIVADRGRRLMIDAMSSFGGIPIDLSTLPCDAIVSSANKCIEGVPGFSFVIVRNERLAASAGNSLSLALDLHAQWTTMEKTGQWRYTPPTHVVAAFAEALAIHAAEGGVAARHARYLDNKEALLDGMLARGFVPLLPREWRSPIIVTFFNPADPAFDFARFYDQLKARHFIIYPGKLTVVDSFRIGCIGRFDRAVIGELLEAIDATLAELGVASATPPPAALAEAQAAATTLNTR